jgi:SRSO17 transposase
LTTIVKVPATVESFFSDLDAPLTDVQRLHLAEYGTGLAVSENVTITGINGLIMGGVDQSNMNRTLTQATWDTEALNRGRLGLLQRHVETMWGKKGFIVVDDTFIDKDGKLLPGAAYLYNHSESRTEWGQQLVTMQYVGPRVDYPLDFRQYFKKSGPEVVSGEVEFRKKHELAAEMIRTIRAAGCPAKTVLMDSWYLGEDFVKVLEEEELDWIARLKSDRLVLVGGWFVPVSEFAGTLGPDDVRPVEIGDKTYWVYEFKTRLKKIGKVKAVNLL